MATTANPLSRAMLLLEDDERLDPALAAATPALDAVNANPTLRDALQGRWVGHALHPLLVMLPLGSWISAAALDAAGPRSAGPAAEFLTGLGVAAAVPAMLTGVAELGTTGRRERRVGLVHAVANVGATVLQAASLVARRRGQRSLGQACSLLGLTLAGAAGYLGGHLSIARGVGSYDPALDR